MTGPSEPRRPELPVEAASRPWRLLDRCITLGIVIGLALPGMGLVAGLRPPEIENRPLATVPAVTVAGLADGSWFGGLGAFLVENLAVRPYAVRVRGEVAYRTGGTGTPAVVRGRGDWLFDRDELEGRCSYDAGRIAGDVHAAATALATAGTRLRFVVAPDKHVLYGDELAPERTFPASCTDASRDDLRRRFAALGGVAIDGWAPLLAARAAQPGGPLLYYEGDTHWTPTGAAIVIGALIRSLDPGLWDDANIAAAGTRRRSVDLAAQIGIRRTEVVPLPNLRPGAVVQRTDLDLGVAIANARTVFETRASGVPTIPGRTLVVYDSFFGISVDLLAPFFADATWVHEADLLAHPELVAGLGRFDVVIVERVERSLYLLDVAALLSPLVGYR